MTIANPQTEGEVNDRLQAAVIELRILGRAVDSASDAAAMLERAANLVIDARRLWIEEEPT